jgi:hypothetical protein
MGLAAGPETRHSISDSAEQTFGAINCSFIMVALSEDDVKSFRQ